MELCIIDKLPFQQTSFRIKRTALKCPNRGFVSFKGQNLPSAAVLKMLLPCMLQSNQIRMALLVVRNRIWKTFACYLLQHVNDPNDDVDFTCANTVSNIQKLFERFETTVCISWKQGNMLKTDYHFRQTLSHRSLPGFLFVHTLTSLLLSGSPITAGTSVCELLRGWLWAQRWGIFVLRNKQVGFKGRAFICSSPHVKMKEHFRVVCLSGQVVV